MVRSLGLPRLAAGLAVLPFAALLAAACGGSDQVDPADAGPDMRALDASSFDALVPPGSTMPDDDASDSDTSDSDLPDTTRPDAGNSDADAAPADADAGLRESGSNDAAAGDADAGGGILGSAKKFAVLAGSMISITPSPPLTTIVGDVGVSPGTAIATLPPGQPVGNIYAGGPVALQAESDLTTAYNSLAGMPCLPANDRTGVDLGGKTLAPGVYCFPNTSAGITGNLVLDAQLDPNAVWVIQVGSTLTTATNATVSVINGGSACNVYWQIGSSATLGTGTKFVGNIVALTSITLVTGSSVLVGRTLARNGAVTLDGNAISAAACP